MNKKIDPFKEVKGLFYGFLLVEKQLNKLEKIVGDYVNKNNKFKKYNNKYSSVVNKEDYYLEQFNNTYLFHKFKNKY